MVHSLLWLMISLFIAGGLWLASRSVHHEIDERGRAQGLPWGAMCFLALMIVVHVLMLSSVKTRSLDPLTYDALVGRGWDFGAVYYGGVAARQGLSVYDMTAGHTTGYRYLPFTALTLGQTLSFLPFDTAYTLWVLVGELILLAFVVWLLLPQPGDPWRLTAAGMVLGFYPLYAELCAGQFDIVQGLLVALMVIWVVRRRETLAAGVWTLSVLFKLNTLIQLVPLIRRRRFVWASVGLLVVLALSAPWLVSFTDGQLKPVLGAEGLLANFRQQDYVWFGNHGFRYFFFLTGTYMSRAWGFPEPHRLGSFVGLAATGLIMAAAVWSTLKHTRVGLQGDLLLWIFVFYLFAAEVWEFSYVTILFPMVVLFLRSKSTSLFLPYALLALPTLYWWVTFGGPRIPQQDYGLPVVVDMLYHSVKPLGMVLLFACIIRLRQRASSGSRTPVQLAVRESRIGKTESG
jgi:hypothetical protein